MTVEYMARGLSRSLVVTCTLRVLFFFFQAEDGIRDVAVTGVQTCALPISVIKALGKEPGKGEGGRGKSGSTPVLRDAAPASPFPLPPSPAVSPAAVPEKGPLELDRLRGLWPRIVDDARARSPLLGALLAVTEVAVAQGGTVGIRLLDTNAVHAEGIERQREALAQLVGRYVTEPVRIKLQGAGSGERSPQRASRMTEEGARQERLRVLRAQDPNLGAAVDALDLELLE